jgi:hypothetical protein
MDRFIVAEISKTWVRGEPISTVPPVAQALEEIINRNFERGYRLHSFTLHRLIVTKNEMNETIIAVFEKEE